MNDKLLKKLILEEIENIIEEAETRSATRSDPWPWAHLPGKTPGEQLILMYERSGWYALADTWDIINKQIPKLIKQLETIGKNVKNVNPDILKEGKAIAEQIRQLHSIKLDNVLTALYGDIAQKAKVR